jgi:hypothetical protein
MLTRHLLAGRGLEPAPPASPPRGLELQLAMGARKRQGVGLD